MISAATITSLRDYAAGLKAMVIGDAMLDRYIHGTVDRISPEAPVPIVNHLYTENKAGGAANVALNLAAWGCQTQLVGMCGDDPGGATLKDLLQEAGIQHGLFLTQGRPTTVKTRIVAASHHMLRIDEESSAYLDRPTETAAIQFALERLEGMQPDLIVLEDYNKGWLGPAMIEAVIGWGRAHGCFIAVDPKDQHFFEYRQADLFKPNLREASQAARAALQPGDLAALSAGWLTQLEVRFLAVTLGAQGVFLADASGQSHVRPTRAVDVVDVCGAGDAVICALALGLMHGQSREEAGHLANLAGAYVCSHSGVVSADPAALEAFL